MVYLQATYELCFGEAYFEYFESCDFSREHTNIDVSVCVWFKDDTHVIWMWIWLILKIISLLDRIWSLWLVRFVHSPPNFIFWRCRLILSLSFNSYPDNICIYMCVFPTCISFILFTIIVVLLFAFLFYSRVVAEKQPTLQAFSY